VPPTLRPELRPYVEQNVAAVNEIAAIVAPPMRLRAAKRAAPVMDAVQQEAIASEQHLAQPQ